MPTRDDDLTYLFDEANDADRKVFAFVMRSWLTDGRPGSDEHLKGCDALPHEFRIDYLQGEDGTYGCDTGCEYYRLEAMIVCPHGSKALYVYGEFGELADLIEAIDRW